MKKILIIIPSLGIGGAEKVALITGEYLMDEYEVEILTFVNDQIEYETKLNRININEKNANWKLIKLLKRYIFILKLKKKKDYAFVFSFSNSANFFNIITKKKENVILSLRGYKQFTKLANSRLKLFLNKKIYNRAYKIICVTEEITKILAENMGIKKSKIKTIYNPYKKDEIEILSRKELPTNFKENLKGKKTIINVGSFKEEKGQLELLKVFKLLLQEDSDLHLLLIGKGMLENQIREYISMLNLTDNVHILGYQLNPYNFIKESDLFILSSFNEGFPNCLVEAMICGVPVISVNCKTGPEEIFADSKIDISDFLAPNYKKTKYKIEEIDETHEALHLLAKKYLYDRNNAAKNVATTSLIIKKFSKENYYNKIESILNKGEEYE